MKWGVFSLYDVKARAYSTPFFLQNVDMAKRSLVDAMTYESASPLSRHPEDFMLYEMGEFDDVSGVFEMPTPIGHGICLSFKEVK
jgi:hypothetical protein